MSLTTLKFTVREDDREFPVCDMSEPESAAIEECVNDLIPREFQYTDTFWFDVDTCFAGEDEGEDMVEYGLLRCFTHNPAPKNGSLLENRMPFPFPKQVLEELRGKTFRVDPRQLGLNPWGTKVEVVFEGAPVGPLHATTPVGPLHPTTPAKKSVAGIKASDLIAAALKAQ